MGKFKERFKTRHVIEKELRHHIVEWTAVLFGIVGAVLNAQLNIYGFYIFILGNFLWMSFSLKHKHWGLLILNIVYLVLNIHGIIVWQNAL